MLDRDTVQDALELLNPKLVRHSTQRALVKMLKAAAQPVGAKQWVN